MNETTKDLVQQGLTAARVGDIEDARRLLTQATQQMPNNANAWLGLAGVVESLEEKKRCFSHVLELDPTNDEARAGLSLVEQKLSAQNSRSPLAPAEEQVDQAGGKTNTGLGVCYRHPQTETGLRCNRCNKFICTKCAQRTPVGFRCPECIREQENRYYTGGNVDYVIAAVVAFPLSLIAAALFTLILGRMGWFFLSIIIGFAAAPVAAGFIAEAVRWAVGRRRSRYLSHVVIGCLVLGTAPFLLLFLLAGNFFGMIMPGMLIFLGSATISARLR
jgi:hypothetical protein